MQEKGSQRNNYSILKNESNHTMARSGDLEVNTTLDQVTMYQTHSELNCLRTVISTSKKEINAKMYRTRSCEIVPQGSCWLYSSPQAEWIKYLQNDYSAILLLLKGTIRNKYSKSNNSRTHHPTLNVPGIANSAWWLLTALKRHISYNKYVITE